MFNYENCCVTCLSEDRNLTPAKLFASFFKEINRMKIETNGGVCWECKSLIMKYSRFKHQVQTVQEIMNKKLLNYQSMSKLTRQTNDTYDFIFSYNGPIIYSEYEVDTKDLKVESIDHTVEEDGAFKEDIYIEHIDIKITDHNTNDYNKVINTIEKDKSNEIIKDNDTQVLTIDNAADRPVKREKRNIIKHTEKLHSKKDLKHKKMKSKNNKGRIKEDKTLQEEFEKKFLSVVLTEEEMTRIREEKRHQPNFKKIPYKCDNCVLGFLTKENYDVHLLKKHDETIGPFICSVCNIRFPYLSSMEEHKSKHYTVYSCKLCKYDTAEFHSAINHCRVKHKKDSTGSIHCSQCLSVCKTPQDLDEHMRKEHFISCNECGAKFKGKHTLRSHKARVHAVKREYSCELCKKTFKSQSRLECHMAGHEASMAKRLAYCSVCEVQYKNIYVYRSHLRNSANHAETLYPCAECDKKFASKLYRTQHYNFYHLQKSKYKCDICNKLFISAWRLKNHGQKYHGLTRPRQHSCNICEKKFFNLSTLRGHMLTHSMERSYMCEDCGDTFKQRPALYTHSRQVHKGGRKVK